MRRLTSTGIGVSGPVCALVEKKGSESTGGERGELGLPRIAAADPKPLLQLAAANVLASFPPTFVTYLESELPDRPALEELGRLKGLMLADLSVEQKRLLRNLEAAHKDLVAADAEMNTRRAARAEAREAVEAAQPEAKGQEGDPLWARLELARDELGEAVRSRTRASWALAGAATGFIASLSLHRHA